MVTVPLGVVVALGNGLTVIEAEVLVFVQPFASVYEYVYVALAPMYGFGKLYIPPTGVPDNAIALPTQPLTPLAVTTGSGFTVTVTVFVSVQPEVFVPVTVYVVVVGGAAITVGPEVVFSPVAGLHK